MLDGFRRRLDWRWLSAAGAGLALVGVVFVGWRLSLPSGAEAVAADAIAAQGQNGGLPAGGAPNSRTVVVYVTGAVARPGMYRLASGLRVGDALAAAGGVLPEADPNRMPNVAAKISDGKQIKVPRAGQSGSGSKKVDINAAAVAELDAVPGMPPGLAQEIVSFRDQYGPFGSLTELKTVLGVDASTLAAIRKYLTVSG